MKNKKALLDTDMQLGMFELVIRYTGKRLGVSCVKRLVVMTVGKTHSGKTTFARRLESILQQAVVIDQDNHAMFVNKHYKRLLPQAGPNTLKHAVTNAIVNYAVDNSGLHILLSNSNLNKSGRSQVLRKFRENGLKSVIVYFDLPAETLEMRVSQSEKDEAVFRSATTFSEVLARQKVDPPSPDEADQLYIIKSSHDIEFVIQKIHTFCFS